MKILIADDESISQRILEVTLRKLGHEVVAVPDGAQAVDTLLCEGAPRLAIVDWEMPKLDGLEVCRRIRLRRNPYVYLILLTARSEHRDMVRALDADVDDFLAKPFDASELRARLRSGTRVLDLQEGLLRTQDELQRLASHDHLTDVLNRRTVVECLQRELTRSSRQRVPLSVLMADLDRFKHINDNYGHATGDTLLTVATQRMRSVLRAHDSIGRYGGDEFLVVLPECDAIAAADIATRIRKAVSDCPAETGRSQLEMSISIGVATTPSGTQSAAELIADADHAVYRAKALGRNRIEQIAEPADLSLEVATGPQGHSSGTSARNPDASRTETSRMARGERVLADTPGPQRSRWLPPS